jgi:hypothetical protein
MFERIRTDEHEEHLKNIVSDFLKDTWYKQTNEINTSGRTDLVIHNGKSSSDTASDCIQPGWTSAESRFGIIGPIRQIRLIGPMRGFARPVADQWCCARPERVPALAHSSGDVRV